METQHTWVERIDISRAAVQEFDQWLKGLVPFAREHELGEQDDLFEAASYGDLEDTGDEKTPIKPVSKDPDMYELRRTALSKKLRWYHGEPPSLPTTLLKVHRHIKHDSATQEVEIRYAATRYLALTGRS